MAAFGTRKLILKVDGTDYSDSVSDVRVVAGESDADFVSFEEARNGGARMYTLAMTLKQDSAAASLWYMAWANAGAEVDVEVWPNGGSTAAVDTPLFTGTVIVTEPDGDFLGGEADRSTKKYFTTEFEWEFTDKPDLDIGA
jgi:hypothetical protein